MTIGFGMYTPSFFRHHVMFFLPLLSHMWEKKLLLRVNFLDCEKFQRYCIISYRRKAHWVVFVSSWGSSMEAKQFIRCRLHCHVFAPPPREHEMSKPTANSPKSSQITDAKKKIVKQKKSAQ